MKSKGRFPVVFVGHGSPMNLVMDNDFTRSLRRLGERLPKPRAVLVVSAHWLSRGTHVTGQDNPQQGYDFYGFPAADIPVLELSLDMGKSEKVHYKLARKLQPLRDEGFLVMGSVNVIHNLELMEWKLEADLFPWACQAEKEIKRLLRQGEHGKLVQYQKYLADAELAAPTNDHFLPMLYTIALREQNDPLTFIHEGIQYASVSMLSFQAG